MRGSACLIPSVLAVLMAACSPEPPPARHTVDEYRANTELRRAQIARCKEDPGSLRKAADCTNAQLAAAFEDRLRLRDAPSIGLDRERNPSYRPAPSDVQGADEPATPASDEPR